MGLFSSTKPEKAKSKKLTEKDCVVTFTIEIPSQEAEQMTQSSLSGLQSRTRIPGFRVGKAPLEIVKQRLSGHAREKALDALIHKHVPEAVTELKLRVIETPVVEDVSWNNGEPLCVRVRVEIAPMPTAKDYLKIPVTRKPSMADEKAVEKRLEDLRQSHARLEASKDEVLTKNHFAVINYAAMRDGKPLANAKGSSELVDLSVEQSVEGLSDGLLGMKRGESKTISVKLGGKATDLTVALTEIKTKILPALDQEFAKDLGFEDLGGLKAKLKEILDKETKQACEADIAHQIEEALLKSNQFPLPPSLVGRHLEEILERTRRQIAGPAAGSEKLIADLRDKLRSRAEQEVRLAFVMSAIAEKEKIVATEADIAAELEAGLKNADTEDSKKGLREAFEKRKDQIAHMICERKTIDFLKSKAIYKDA